VCWLRGDGIVFLYGSSGSVVFVSPDPIDRRRIFEPAYRFKENVVEFGYTLGGTSGRFEVAAVSSRLFPIARDFVNAVAKDQKDIGGPPLDLGQKSLANDRIVGRSDTVVRFVTSAGHKGLGTRSRLAVNASPIDGFAALVKDGGDWDLIELNIRLPAKDRDFVLAIQSVAERNHGASLTNALLHNPER
jgi:hypothetical protein